VGLGWLAAEGLSGPGGRAEPCGALWRRAGPQEEAAALRERLAAAEAELRGREGALREAEGRLVALDARARTEIAETQASRGEGWRCDMEGRGETVTQASGACGEGWGGVLGLGRARRRCGWGAGCL
jgi:hypothetical protein